MPVIGRARVGHKAPDFQCEAVLNGEFKDISLETFTRQKQWLILLFIPAAFSFVCPTEVLAFHNCIDEFHERNCEIVFVSTDSKHCLWQWQNMSRKAGGLGKVRVMLASDQSHAMSRDYGVLLEGKGMDLRGMFIVDAEGVLQQSTVNNVAVGRSVLEALRLLEAFKVAGEKGVLCPVNWQPGQETLDGNYTDYEDDGDREELEKGMEDMQIKNLDNNTSQPFNLVLPTGRSKEGKSTTLPQSPLPQGQYHLNANHNAGMDLSAQHSKAPRAQASKRHSLQSLRNSITNGANTAAANEASKAANSKVVTLEFSDPLTEPQGKDRSHGFVAVKDDQRLSSHPAASDGNGKAMGSTSPTNMQRGLDALKRMSSGWSTPLGSPGLNGPEKNLHSSAVGNGGGRRPGSANVTSSPREGYFD